jgi:hypothetical protein
VDELPSKSKFQEKLVNQTSTTIHKQSLSEIGEKKWKKWKQSLLIR